MESIVSGALIARFSAIGGSLPFTAWKDVY